jgi:hypothetical protein
MPAKWLTKVAATAVCMLGLAPSAAAQTSDPDALFQKGLEAMRAGRYATACPLLEQSYRLDPLPGALFTVAECEAAWGKLAAAVRHYQSFLDALTSLPPGRRDAFEERRKIAADKMAALTAVMPEITIDVLPGTWTGLVVKRNGEVVGPSSYGVTQKVDPGPYVITAQAEGGSVWERRVELGERDRARIDVPWPLPGADSAKPVEPSTAAVESSDSTRRSSTRTWAYVAGGVGAVGLVTGSIAGIVAMANKSSIDANCPNHLCNAEGRSAVNAGQSAATISTIAFPVGLAGGGLAALLFVLSSGRTDSGSGASFLGLRPYVAGTPQGGAAAVEGSF